jgi:hypothetical protein
LFSLKTVVNVPAVPVSDKQKKIRKKLVGVLKASDE